MTANSKKSFLCGWLYVITTSSRGEEDNQASDALQRSHFLKFTPGSNLSAELPT